MSALRAAVAAGVATPPRAGHPPRTRWRPSLRARLALLVLAGLLPMLLLNLAGVAMSYRIRRADAAERTLELARGVAAAVGAELRAQVAALEVLALSPALAAGDLAGFRAQAEAVLARQLPGANILLLRGDGQQLVNAALPPDAVLPRRADLANLRRVLETGRPAVSDMYDGVALHRAVVAVEVPVPGAGLGDAPLVLALNPAPDTFDAVLRRAAVPPGWVVALLDRAGVRVARTDAPERHVGRRVGPALLAAVARGPEGRLEATSADGVRVLVAFSRVEAAGWTVAVGMPVAALAGPVWRATWTTLGVGAVLMAAGLLLAGAVARRILRPIEALQRQAMHPDGDSPADRGLATGLVEVDRVAAALAAEARDRRAALAALRDSERRLRLAVAELNHRAKNALATVQALAQQTARGDAGAAADPQRFARLFTARLAALARAHDLLAATAWEPARLDAVLRAGLAPWLAAPGDAGAPPVTEEDAPPRVALRLPDGAGLPTVAPAQAQALVLALFELATNATKHGALSRPGGRVTVACRAEPGGPAALIAWEEAGGPPVPGRPARTGFGTRLLERALARDLGPGGRVALDYAPAGLRAAIRVVPRGAGAEAGPARAA